MWWVSAALGLLSLGLLLGWTPVTALLLAWGLAASLLRSGAGQGQESVAPAHSATHLGRESRSGVTRSADEPDAPDTCKNTSVHEALEKVFTCIYHQYIWVWIDGPEPAREQPLYKALQKELFEAVEAIHSKTAHLNRTEVMVGLINSLTRHLHRCNKDKESPRKTILGTETEKIAFFRRYTQELIAYLLPPSLSQSQHTKVLLNEILALQVFKPTMQTLSDPDFLNQMLIRTIDPTATQTFSYKPFPTGDQEAPTQSSVLQEHALNKNPHNDDEGKAASKPKKKGFKNGLRKIKKILKPRSHSKSVGADCLDADFGDLYRSYGYDSSGEDGQDGLETDGVSSDTSDIEERSDMENHMSGSDLWSLLTKMLCEEWSHGSWTATISNLQVLHDGLLMCSIHVENEQCPAEKHWDIERNLHTFLWIQNKLIEDFPELDKFSIDSLLNQQPKMESTVAKDILSNFLQSLVSIVQTSQNSEALFFLLPFEVSAEEEFPDMESSDELEADGLETSSFRAFEQKPNRTQRRRRVVATFQDILPPETCNETSTLEDPCDGTLKTALSKLLAEVLGTPLSLLLKCTSIQDILLAKVDEMVSEWQLDASIDSLRETLWPNGEPAPPIPILSPEEKEDTRSKAEKLLLNLCRTKVICGCWKRIAGKVFKIFQEADQNEELIYRWLLLLLDKVIPRKDRSWTTDDILTVE